MEPLTMGLMMGGSIIGNQLSNEFGSRRSLRHAKEMADYNAQIGRENASMMRKLNLQTWKDTNFSAQMQELKKAGLSPALMYKQGGAGGTLGNASATQGSGSGYSGDSNAGVAALQAASDLELKKTQQENIEQDTNSKEIDNILKAQGIEDKKEKEKLLAEISRRKAEEDIDVLFGHPREARYWEANEEKPRRPVTRYQQAELDKLQSYSLDNLVKQAQEGLSKATASNLLSNDELVRLQTSLLSAELGIIESESFKKLPRELQGVLMMLMKRFGGR